jgi:formylglycine-generating enzyme
LQRTILLLSSILLIILGGLSCTDDHSGNPIDSVQSITAPTDLLASATSDTFFALQWAVKNASVNDANAPVTTLIEKSVNGSSFSLVDSVAATITSKSVTGVYRTGTTYSFRVRTKSTTEFSPYSNIAATSLVFPAPSNLTLLAVGGVGVGLQWKDNSSFETGFLIELSMDGGAFTLVDCVGADVTTTLLNIVFLPNIAYSFRMRARSAYNFSAYSAVLEIQMHSGDPSMVVVTGGTFQMGGTVGASDEMPVHSVTIASFYMDKTEITYEKWMDVRDWGLTHGYDDLPTGSNGSNSGGSNNPVTDINWYDILKWCNARSEMDRLTPVYCMDNTLSNSYRTGRLDLASDAVKWTANGYRLPTEAEWEFAAQGGTKSQGYKYSGSNTIDDVAWYFDNSGVNTHPVATKAPNELGLYDMSGNVWEWCWDWYGFYTDSPQTDPKGPTSGTFRVTRGGSFTYTAAGCRLANRDLNYPSHRNAVIGFRCVQH